MYKLIIIDDEEKIASGMAQLFPWQNIGFEVVQVFTSARKALQYIAENPVDVVVLTIPQNAAQNTANRLIDLGIQGFWNFTNVELTSTRPNVKIENIHFADSLLTLSYRIANS